jgi:hypothetical protein
MATKAVARSKQLHLVRKPEARVQAEVLLATMVRWLASRPSHSN